MPETVVISAIAGWLAWGRPRWPCTGPIRSLHRFPDGQLYVNLRGFDLSGAPMTPGQAICKFLAALGVPADQYQRIWTPRPAGTAAHWPAGGC